MLSDLRCAFRQFASFPGFTVVAVLTLALGIGVNTAMFSVVYGVLIDPYPYAKSNEIWAPFIEEGTKGRHTGGVLADALEAQKLSAFADVMATAGEEEVLSGHQNPEVLSGILVTGNAFSFLGVPPLLGRGLMPSDIRADGQAENVVVLTFQLWQRLFSGDPAAIGKTLMLNGQPHLVVGVMPPRFGWYTNNSLWLPMPRTNPAARRVRYIVRLQPGLTREQAGQQLQALDLAMAKERPNNFPKGPFSSQLVNYLDVTSASGQMQASLHLLFWAVAFLLLIACSNVANLQLARGTARAREIAIRLAVGAGRLRLIRQLLTESILLAGFGGAVGVGLALGIIKMIVLLMPPGYVPNESRVTLNGYALAFLAGISVFSGILFGLVPAWRSTRVTVYETLKDGSQGAGASRGGGRIRGVLIVSEVALSVILLVGAGLTIRGFIDLERVDLGFQPAHLLIVGVPHSAQRYPTYALGLNFDRELLDRVSNLPGVVSAGWSLGGIPADGWRTQYELAGRPKDPSQQLIYDLVSANFRRTLGIRLLAGRDLTEAEIAHADGVALISEAAARLWPAGTNPIGQQLTLDDLAAASTPDFLAPQSGVTGTLSVVGIVGDVRSEGEPNSPTPTVYLPYSLRVPRGRRLDVRTSGKPFDLLNLVRREVKAIDPEQPLNRTVTAEDLVGYATVQPKFNMVLLSSLGGIGLLLAVAGVYSSLSYHVAHRTREIGVRIALGAEPKDVVAMVLTAGMRLVATGLVIGLAGSLALARLLNSEVFLVPATDPIALAAACLVLTLAALAACWVPARRAARVDPVVALRAD